VVLLLRGGREGEGRKGKEWNGKEWKGGKGGKEKWYPHFLDESYAPGHQQ